MNLNELPTKQDLIDLEIRLLRHINQLAEGKPAQRADKWMRSKEVRELLDISPGTLKTLRINGSLPYTRIGATLLYDRTEVEQILEKNRVENKAQ